MIFAEREREREREESITFSKIYCIIQAGPCLWQRPACRVYINNPEY